MPPLRRLPDRSWVRPAYQPESYAVPASEFERLRGYPHSVIEELAIYDGMYRDYEEIGRTQREGVTFVRLFHTGHGYLLEVALTDAFPPDLRAVPPEDAWLFARELDRRAVGHRGYVALEGDPPPGLTDPNPR